MANSAKALEQDYVRGQEKSAVRLVREFRKKKIRIVKKECRKHVSLRVEANSPFASSSVLGLEQPFVQGFYCGLGSACPIKPNSPKTIMFLCIDEAEYWSPGGRGEGSEVRKVKR